MPKRGRRKKSPYVAYARELEKEKKDAKAIASSLSPRAREILDKHVHYRATPIFWGIPMDEVVYAKFFSQFLKYHIMPWDSFGTTESTYISSARNDIHRAFVEDSDCDYMMMLDSDIVAPPEILPMLLAHDKHIVGGWYCNKNYGDPPHPIVYDYLENGDFTKVLEPRKGLEKVAGMGAGCWLMTRELGEALGPKPYSMEGGGEDLELCKKIHNLGYDIWVDWEIPCAHLGVSWV